MTKNYDDTKPTTTQCTICGKTITISIQEHFIKRHQHKKEVIYDIHIP